MGEFGFPFGVALILEKLKVESLFGIKFPRKQSFKIYPKANKQTNKKNY